MTREVACLPFWLPSCTVGDARKIIELEVGSFILRLGLDAVRKMGGKGGIVRSDATATEAVALRLRG